MRYLNCRRFITDRLVLRGGITMRMRRVSIWPVCLLFLIQSSTISDSECLAGDLKPSVSGASGTTAEISVARNKFSTVLVIRLKQGEDLLRGLQKAVAQEGVKNGVFMGAFGSMTSYHVHVVNNTTFPPKNIYTKGKGPFDILSVTGAVIDGRLHPHLTFSDSKRAYGGHLEEGSLVFTFAVITLGVFEERIILDKFDDWNWQ